MNERVFVFRIAQDSDYVKKELKAGRLRQGWGSKQTNLLGVSENEWVIKQSQRDPFWGSEKYYSSKYKNLSIMILHILFRAKKAKSALTEPQPAKPARATR